MSRCMNILYYILEFVNFLWQTDSRENNLLRHGIRVYEQKKISTNCILN